MLHTAFQVPGFQSPDRFAPFALPPVEAVDKASFDGTRLLFLDIEASSLGPGSWPIEIGCAWIEASRVRTRSSLISPRPHWSMDVWSQASEQVHGISIGQLRAGRSADEIAAVADGLAGFTLVSDNPLHDQAWLDRLREDRPPIRIQSLRIAVATLLAGPEADMFALLLLRGSSEHRAGPDAERLARAWIGATRRRAAA